MRKIKKSIQSIWADSTRTFARTPREFTLKDWKNALVETKNAIRSKKISILAAGVAYFLTFAVFPAIAAMFAVLSFVLSESQLTAAVKAF